MKQHATLTLLAAALMLSSCGTDDNSGIPGTAAGGAGGSGGSGGAGGTSTQSDAGSPDSAPPADAGPTTTALDPCATAACYNGRTLGACGAAELSEDFSSGLYGVHRRLLMAPAGVAITIAAERTAGSWSPLLIVHDESGATVHDGVESHTTPALAVTALSPGPDVVGVQLTATTRMHLSVFLTGASVVSGGFTGSLPTDAAYALEVSVACPAEPPLTVRGVQLDPEQDLWVRYIARHVVPLVPGTSAERIAKSAHVTWWALKEGVLNVNNPLSYSNCSFPPDQPIGPLETCPNPGNAWQVGLSGVQAAYTTVDNVEQLALGVLPQLTIAEMLVASAVTAGFGAGTAQGNAIAVSQDRLRLSWLLRHSPIGFEAQYYPVYNQCFVQTQPWCFGTGWPSSASFAPTQAAALEAITDLEAIFQALGP